MTHVVRFLEYMAIGIVGGSLVIWGPVLLFLWRHRKKRA